MTPSKVGELRIRLFGGLEVEGITDRELGSRKARTLVKVLALARSAPVPADRIVDALWSDDLPARPLDQVGVLVSRLRPVLGADRLRRTDAGWALEVDWLDVDELDARVDEASARIEAGSHAAALAAARAALALVTPPGPTPTVLPRRALSRGLGSCQPKRPLPQDGPVRPPLRPTTHSITTRTTKLPCAS